LFQDKFQVLIFIFLISQIFTILVVISHALFFAEISFSEIFSAVQTKFHFSEIKTHGSGKIILFSQEIFSLENLIFTNSQADKNGFS
jgi:hypothetical protein